MIKTKHYTTYHKAYCHRIKDLLAGGYIMLLGFNFLWVNNYCYFSLDGPLPLLWFAQLVPGDMALVGPYLGVYYFNFLIARYVEGGKHLGLPLVGKILRFQNWNTKYCWDCCSRYFLTNYLYQIFSDFSNTSVNLSA